MKMPSPEKRQVLVGVLIDTQKDLLCWAIVKVAEPGDCVVAIHVSRNSGKRLQLGFLVPVSDYVSAYVASSESVLKYGIRSSFQRQVVAGKLSASV